MAKTQEGKIQGAVISYAHRRGIRTIRMFFGPGMQTGWPDVLFLAPRGRTLFIEFKSGDKLPTRKQEEKIKILQDLNHEVEVCRDIEAGKLMVESMLVGPRNARGMIR